MNVVVDTNVLVYYWLPGAHTEVAVALRESTGDWYVPKLWRSEFRNVLAGYLQRGELEVDAAKALIRTAESELVEFECEIDSSAVLELAAESGRSAYDCEFVALARSMSLRLVTEDRRILSSFPLVAVRMSALLG